MPYVLSTAHLLSAFRGEPVKMHDFEIGTSVRSLGDLCVTSGRIVACDALVMPDTAPFACGVPNGMHPVDVAITHAPEGDQRIAFARVRFAACDAVRWDMALMSGQSIDEFAGDDEFVGYGVDSGTGCFADPAACGLLAQRIGRDKKFVDTILKQMKSNYVHTRDWADVRPADDRPENVILFTSGLGDGVYPSFFGFDADGKVVALVTDFGVLVEHDDEPREKSDKPWWKFW